MVPFKVLCIVFAQVFSVIAVKYVAPDMCQWDFFGPEAQDVSLMCRVAALNSTFFNVSDIPSDHTVRLHVDCTESQFIHSSLDNNSFQHLFQLKELRVEHCKMQSLPTLAFVGLGNLRNLTVRTYNGAWSTLNLQVQPHMLAPLAQLERLDFGYNAVWTLPPRTFCHLTNLVSLNLSNNNFQDVNTLGFSSFNSDDSCQLDVKELDLSNNDLHVLPAGAFDKLRGLRQLFLQDNQISLVSESAFDGLRLLQLVDLAGNNIVALPPEVLHNMSELVELYLHNNSLSVLPAGLFSGLQQLLVLNLHHNELTSNWIDNFTFEDLIRLIILDLSHNRLSSIDASTFRNLYSLQILHLEHNEIDIIADNSFSSMYNLHTLLISHNKLHRIDAYTLNGLYVLSLLSLDFNRIDFLHPDAFKNCSGLQDLNLFSNHLRTVPQAIAVLQFLKTVDLGQNRIDTLFNASFRGLQQLTGLILIDNSIGNVSRNIFNNMPALKILNLARNKIRSIEHGTFDGNVNLQAIRLDSNFLTDMNGLFAGLPALIWLNISANEISWFDYALIPIGLQWLDIHANHIAALGNYFDLEAKLQLQIMDASSNRITEINASSLADGIQLLFLNDNQISKVQPFTFLKKNNLSRVDLFGNNIQFMDLSALRLAHFGEDRPLPEFYLGGNPFQCDCNMEWLQRINYLDQMRQHPKVMDLDSIYCKLLYSRDRTFVPLVEAHPSQFLCPYTAHCFTLCKCCDFDACDCEMVCPDDCTCYHDQSWLANIVACTNANYTQMPEQIPMDATEIYLDGNHIKTLSSHTFIGRKNLRVLFLNGSFIHTINNRTFNGLRALQILHLEDNSLTDLRGYEFERLEILRELYLQNNKLATIHNTTFIMLKSLEILRLDGNHIHHLPVWNFSLNPMLWEVTLSDNPWSCHCHFMEQFKRWLSTHQEKIRDATHLRCLHNTTGVHGTSVLEFNMSTCDNATATWMVQPKFIEDYMSVFLIAAGILAVLLLVLCAAMCHWWQRLRLCVFSRWGVRLCKGREDEGKLFDAYICYSSNDECFVRNILAPDLERGGEHSYFLVLHHRDCPVGSFENDIVIEASDNSKRFILVLTQNFIKNEWSRNQVKENFIQLFKERHTPLIVVVFGVVSKRDMDQELRLCLKNSTCITWGDKLFWAKLKLALPEQK
uniref:Toll family protein LongTollA n=1 Tax=Strigamia maritima TaxID=126957 RepID=T1J446_STRMM|nr:toll family protein LongTollA [Strigamia maritima]